MASNKVVGFEIKITGQKDITSTAKVLGLVNEQLLAIDSTLTAIQKKGGIGLNKLSKSFKATSSSAKQLGGIVKESFLDFEKGNNVVKDLGNGYFEVTKQVSNVAKEFKDLEKAQDNDSKSVQDLIEKNKELKKILQSQPIGQQSEEVKKLTQEYSKNNDAIKEFRKELRTGKKASEAQEGSLDQLRKKAADLKKQYNALGAEQQSVFSKEGRKIRKELLATQKRIQKLDTAVKDGRSSIGLYGKAQAGLTKTLLKLSVGRSVADGVANGLRSIFNGLKEIATGSEEAQETFSELNTAGDRLSTSLNTVGTGILKSFGPGISKLINSVAFAVKVVGDAFVSASEGTGFFATTLRVVGDLLVNFPAVFGGIGAVIGNFADTFVNSITEIKLNAELLIATVKRLGTALTGGDTSEIEANINRINIALERNVVFAKSIGEAYTEGYNSTLLAQEEFNKATDIETKEIKKREAQAKINEEASKKRAEDRKKRIAEEQKNRASLLEQIQNESIARVKIAIDLDKKLRDLEISLIQDSTQKAIALEKQKFNQEKKAREENLKERIESSKKQEEELIRIFGVFSQEFADFTKNSDRELFQLQQKNNQISELQAQQHQDNLLKITIDGKKSIADAERKAFEDEVLATELELDELNRIEGEASDRLIEKQIEDGERSKELRNERNEATKSAIIDLVNSTIQAISDISQIAFDAENARFEQAIENRQANISNLNDDLQNATGLQKKFLQIQVKQEEEALEKETKLKEEALRRQAETQKAIAIVQAVIAAALGIANAFTIPPPASFIAAAATAVATAAQIAVIASQKFAEGGLIGANAVANVGNGKIKGKSNIGKQPNGDNILATVKTGEVILNEEQQRRLGGYKTFASIGVPGFQNGGITGPPISAPNIGSQSSDVDAKFNQFIAATTAMAIATNNRIDNLTVNLDLNNLQDVQDNEASLEALTTFE